MIFSNMEYPSKDYRVQVYDVWLGEEFEPMDNPKNGDKIVYRIIGENGQPVEQKTEVYQNGAWVEQGGGGGGDIATITIVNETNFNWTLKGAFAISQGGMSASYYEIDSNVFPIEGGDYGVFLYEGQAIVTLIPDAHHHVEWSGNVTSSGGGYLVTGDCSVTLTA